MYQAEPKEPIQFGCVSGSEIQNICIGRSLAWMDGPGVGAEAPEARPSLIGRNEAPFVFQLDAPLQMWGTETRARNAVYTSVGGIR